MTLKYIVPVFVCVVLCNRFVNGGPTVRTKDPLEDSGQFQGDIKLPIRTKNAINDPSLMWPNGEIPFEMIGEFEDDQLDTLDEVINDVHENTCIRLRKKRSDDQHWLIITSLQSGCWSYVGMQPEVGGQETSLGTLCKKKGVMAHELMHVMGFWHEHSRTDRDNFIDFVWDNVREDKKIQMRKLNPGEANLLTAYDYTSLLHYGAFAFAIDFTKPSINPKKSGVTIGQREGFSPLDYAKINRLYKCKVPTTTSTSTSSTSTKSTTTSKTTTTTGKVTTTTTPKPTTTTSSSSSTTTTPAKLTTTTTAQFTCTKPQNCEDSDPLRCPDYALKGYCQALPGRFLSECRKSCCNCNYDQCYDSNINTYVNNACMQFKPNDPNAPLIMYPYTCFHPVSAEIVQRFCPRLCGTCPVNPYVSQYNNNYYYYNTQRKW